MRILTPIVVIIPFSIVANQQIFVPMGKEKLILKSTLTGAVTNFTFNMLLIPRYAQNGAAVATVLAEGAVSAVCFMNIRRYFDMKKVFRYFGQYWLAALPIVPLALLVRSLHLHAVYTILMDAVLSAACYFALLGLFKNPYLQMGIKMVKSKLKNFHTRREAG